MRYTNIAARLSKNGCKVSIHRVLACARDVQHAEDQAAAWFAALKKMTHGVIAANGVPRGGKFVTVGELSMNVLRSGDSASRRALGEMLARFTWIKADCAVWDLTRAIREYPGQVQAALIQAARECDVGHI